MRNRRLGIRPRYSGATNVGGSYFVSHLLHAAAAIVAGLCEVALVHGNGSVLSSQVTAVLGSRETL